MSGTAPTELRLLGEELQRRSDEVVSDMVRRSREAGCMLDAIVEESFERRRHRLHRGRRPLDGR
jgi:hypothetical protein